MLIINNLDAISENDVRRIEVDESIRKDSVAFFGKFRQRDHVAGGTRKEEKVSILWRENENERENWQKTYVAL